MALRSRSRAFHASVLFVGALVIFQFVAPRASLLVQIGNVLNGTAVIHNGTINQLNFTLEDANKSALTTSKITKPPSGSNIEMTDTMTLVHADESNVKDANNTVVHQDYSSNDSPTVRNESYGDTQANVPVVTANYANLTIDMPQHETMYSDSTMLTAARKSRISLSDENTTFSDAETTKIKARLVSLREQTRKKMKRRKRNHTILNKFNTTAGFIHLGKTGGSTLSLLLRNGCHSFVKKPCHKVTNETIVSELVTHYYHTPDLQLIPKSKHELYFVTTRDPLERLISAFAFLHPTNILSRKERANGIQRAPNRAAYKCFPSLEKFAIDLGTTGGGYCSAHAKRAVSGRVEIMNHLYSNYHKMVAPIPADAQVYVFRNEHIWEDWVAVNEMLAPNQTIIVPTGQNSTVRDLTKVKQPVSRDLSDRGRGYLCRAIQQEYEVFFSVLKRAVNLNETDIQEAQSKANENCPNLVAPRVSLIGSKNPNRGKKATQTSVLGVLSDGVRADTAKQGLFAKGNVNSKKMGRPTDTLSLASTHNKTMATKSGATAGFIHIGKCGGSSLTSQLRNGCHSFVKKPCAVIENETAISELVSDYYHVPDAGRIPASRHDMYFVTSRDPLDRVLSAFVYLHPRNRNARNETGNGIPTKANQLLYHCFPTVEKFAYFLGTNDSDECSVRARRAVRGKIKIMVHLWANYKKMVTPIHMNAKVYVIRQERMWQDWRTINEMVDPNRTVFIPTGDSAHGRDMTDMNQPVTRDLSNKGRENLCRAMKEEYEIYFRLLNRALNLNETDIQEAREKARINCPSLMEQSVSLRVTVSNRHVDATANG